MSSSDERGEVARDRRFDDVLAEIEQDASIRTGDAFARMVAEYFADAARGAGPVSDAPSIEDGVARFAEPLPVGGAPLASLLSRLAWDVIPGSNRLVHPMYIGHQVSAPLPISVWTDALISALNQSLAVREMSPVATFVEDRVVRWLTDLIGWGDAAGGTMTSGGTEASFTALLAARNAVFPDAWESGLKPDAGALVCGEHAHYAIARAAGEIGIGTRNVVPIPSREYRMDPHALEAALAELERSGRRVVAVVATAGSTATGAFDELTAITSITARRGVWLHVDGAHGATALLSPRHRHRLSGIDGARTVAWDAHKMMLLPVSAGMLVARDEKDLERAFSQSAPYLFHASGDERVWDQGIRSFACSRRADALKLWVVLQRHGADGIGLLYEHLCDQARLCWEEVVEREDFEAMHEPESNILCFRWAPPGIADAARLDELNWKMRDGWNRSGAGWITTTLLDGRRVLRITVMNPRTGPEHIRATLDGLSALGRELLAG